MAPQWSVNRCSLFTFSVINLHLHIEELIISAAVFGPWSYLAAVLSANLLCIDMLKCLVRGIRIISSLKSVCLPGINKVVPF